jgi:hypothetical protein
VGLTHAICAVFGALLYGLKLPVASYIPVVAKEGMPKPYQLPPRAPQAFLCIDWSRPVFGRERC